MNPDKTFLAVSFHDVKLNALWAMLSFKLVFPAHISTLQPVLILSFW